MSQWSNLALFNAFLLGTYVASVAGFLKWRFRKKIVTKDVWHRLVAGYMKLESDYQRLSLNEEDTLAGYEAMTSRLDRAQDENDALRRQLQGLEVHLDDVTTEATTLVTGLRQNEQRWNEAEELRLDLQAALGQANQDLTESAKTQASMEAMNLEVSRRLTLAQTEAAEAHGRIADIEAELAGRLNLESRLNEVLARDRNQMETLGRLEQRYRTTHSELDDSIRYAQSLQSRLDRQPHGYDTPPVPAGIDLRSTDILEPELQGSSFDQPLPPGFGSHEPSRRHYRRRLSRASARSARSFGTLPD